MKTPSIALLTASFLLVGCSDAPTEPDEAGPLATLDAVVSDSRDANPNATPIEFVSTFAAFVDGSITPVGNSERLKEKVTLQFDVTGDLVGTSTTSLSNNNGIEKNGFATSIGRFVIDVCWTARGLCGEFEGHSAGKITPAGVDFPIMLAHGSGGFEGMKLQGTLLECPGGGAGCFSGHVIE